LDGSETIKRGCPDLLIGVALKKNTGDLQWKLDAVCNVRLCKGERNANGARTMGSNGKTMRRTMEAMKKGHAT
jgi:hypothetical protein